MIRRFGEPLLAGAVLLTSSGCSGIAADAAGEVVTVTVDSTAPATLHPNLVPAPRALPPVVVSNPSPQPTATATATATGSGSGSPGTTSGRARKTAVVSTPAPVSQTTSPSAPRTLQVRSVVDVAGPDNGPPCSVAQRYSDEPPTGLRAEVKAAWLSVKKRAAAQGVTLCLNDGKRSRAQQTGLFNSYVKEYGTATAHDLVLPWQKSAHVKGDAVDVQPTKAYQWLEATKGAMGFCRMYDNEAWHFEFSLGYRTSGCPARQPEPVG